VISFPEISFPELGSCWDPSPGSAKLPEEVKIARVKPSLLWVELHSRSAFTAGIRLYPPPHTHTHPSPLPALWGVPPSSSRERRTRSIRQLGAEGLGYTG